MCVCSVSPLGHQLMHTGFSLQEASNLDTRQAAK
ncbi:protein of unknown function [Blastococcus saxobsidens DD2]|uniref:Uncharacterized protein n=1 Tax=Blastococcus saxobsidens (strain DD2) TaxID=1146883 RepID=H6RJU3_BLASD|nr:protein of unknown function [Blastococcus saxobsidens DD2]